MDGDGARLEAFAHPCHPSPFVYSHLIAPLLEHLEVDPCIVAGDGGVVPVDEGPPTHPLLDDGHKEDGLLLQIIGSPSLSSPRQEGCRFLSRTLEEQGSLILGAVPQKVINEGSPSGHVELHCEGNGHFGDRNGLQRGKGCGGGLFRVSCSSSLSSVS